jgi:hypothetical protein
MWSIALKEAGGFSKQWKAMWGRNWINSRVPDVTLLAAADDTVRTVYPAWTAGRVAI